MASSSGHALAAPRATTSRLHAAPRLHRAPATLLAPAARQRSRPPLPRASLLSSVPPLLHAARLHCHLASLLLSPSFTSRSLELLPLLATLHSFLAAAHALPRSCLSLLGSPRSSLRQILFSSPRPQPAALASSLRSLTPARCSTPPSPCLGLAACYPLPATSPFLLAFLLLSLSACPSSPSPLSRPQPSSPSPSLSLSLSLSPHYPSFPSLFAAQDIAGRLPLFFFSSASLSSPSRHNCPSPAPLPCMPPAASPSCLCYMLLQRVL